MEIPTAAKKSRGIKTKIVATIGPATWDDNVLKKMIGNGMRVVRVNASFADYDEFLRVTTQIRSLSTDVSLLLDTMGHKIRVTGFKDSIEVKTGEQICLTYQGGKHHKEYKTIEVTYNHIVRDMTRNATILIDDGNIILKVVDIDDELLMCDVIKGGPIFYRKTVTIPNIHLSFPPMTAKDKEDIRTAIELKYEYVSASFVRDIDDAKAFRRELGDSGIKLIAKIENYEGILNFERIIDEVDGVMIARGDLGVELPIEYVPYLQKKMIRKCREKGKIVIVATQMLESMKDNDKPTRAEVSDIANAIYDGTDAIMLSAETSTGKYPILAVDMMRKVASITEPDVEPDIMYTDTESADETDTICIQTAEMTKIQDLKGIIVITKTGKTIRSLVRHRIKPLVWCVTHDPFLAKQLIISRGVTPIYMPNISDDRDKLIHQTIKHIYSLGELHLKDKVAIIFGSTIKGKSINDILEIVQVKNVLSELSELE